MASIPGASQFVNAARLANSQGRPAVSTNLLGSFETPSLLDAAQNLRSRTGDFNFGSSQRARAYRKQLQQGASNLFSLTGTGNSTVEANVAQINALRARNARFTQGPQSNISALVEDNGRVTSSNTRGNSINTVV